MAGGEFDGALGRASVLVIEGEPGVRNFLVKMLEPRVKRVAQALSPAEAEQALDRAHFDVVLLDKAMPGMAALEWIVELRRKGGQAAIILTAAHADLETVLAALRAGVSDFIPKPFRGNQISEAITRVLERKMPRHGHRPTAVQMLGKSPAMSSLRDMLHRLAPLPTPVLFTGASGTGKELAARQLHQMSNRAAKPFVVVNCAAIAPERMVTELFGRVADDGRLKPGLLSQADGGVLFLDDVALLPEPQQAALLRVLEDQRIRPQGSDREIALDLRILCATNADLEQGVAEGRFRADFYHRINVVRIEMPLLRDRAEDIVELAALFMEQFSSALEMPTLRLDEETLLKLRRYEWPGNVRELRNLIERSVILGFFPDEFAGQGAVAGMPAIEDLDLVVQRHMLHMLDLCNGNRAEAARRLGVSRKTIDRKLQAWGEVVAG